MFEHHFVNLDGTVSFYPMINRSIMLKDLQIIYPVTVALDKVLATLRD